MPAPSPAETGTGTGFHPALPAPVNGHDPLCVNAAGPCCPWMTGGCDCQCSCEDIARIRRDQSERDNAWHNNPCMSCGPHAEYSTYICDDCGAEMSASLHDDHDPDDDAGAEGAPV